VRHLLNARADLEAPQAGEGTALVGALAAGHTQVAHDLITAGARLDAADAQGTRALELAVRSGDATLLAAISARAGWQPSAADLEAATCAASARGSLDGIRFGVERGISPELVCTGSRSLLANAAQRGELAVVQLLLTRGARPDGRTAGDNTPLHLAAHAGHTQVVAALLDAGAEIDARGPARETPLMRAAVAGQREVVALLLARGARAGARNVEGRSARALAEQAGQAAVVAEIEASSGGQGGWLDRF
jgi:ankyrin repeat protein